MRWGEMRRRLGLSVGALAAGAVVLRVAGWGAILLAAAGLVVWFSWEFDAWQTSL